MLRDRLILISVVPAAVAVLWVRDTIVFQTGSSQSRCFVTSLWPPRTNSSWLMVIALLCESSTIDQSLDSIHSVSRSMTKDRMLSVSSTWQNPGRGTMLKKNCSQLSSHGNKVPLMCHCHHLATFLLNKKHSCHVKSCQVGYYTMYKKTHLKRITMVTKLQGHLRFQFPIFITH